MRKLISVLAAAALAAVVSGCGGKQEVYEVLPDRSMAAARGVTLPEPVPAVPAYVAKLDRAAKSSSVDKATDTPGVAVVAPLEVEESLVRGPGGRRTLRVAAVEPLLFRSVAPPATRDADFVWAALIAGDAVVTFDAANKLGLNDADKIKIGGKSLNVTAFAENGTPNFADVLVADFRGEELGIGGSDLLVVGAKSGITLESLGATLKNRLPGAKLRRLLPDIGTTAPGAPQPAGESSGGVIGSMSFTVLEGGFIQPDAGWVASNITSATVPILGSVTCHRLMIPQLAAALSEIEREGLSDLVYQYGGCYVPRFIDRDPSKPLSMHAFGLAFDINVSTNYYGTRGDLDMRVVEIFERWGFAWGGWWNPPDPMHFELARLIQT